MSALGHKQTFAPQKVMSALRPEADIPCSERDVRFVPIADIVQFSPKHRSHAGLGHELTNRPRRARG
jgi:hypothetical protein